MTDTPKTKTAKSSKKKQEGKRDLKKAAHKEKLVDATIESIATFGYAGTTVSTIQTISGLSRGMINLHFSSKETLFQAALKRLADNYETFWRAALIKGGSKPAKQLLSVIESDLSDKVLKSAMLPVWFAFRSEAHIHPEYLSLYGTRDSDYTEMLYTICQELADQSPPLNQDETFAKDSASGIYAMIEGFWVEAFLHPENFDSARAKKVLKAFISSRFPSSF